jgi:hypothetical protein
VAPTEHYAPSQALVDPLLGSPGARRGLASKLISERYPRRAVPPEAAALSGE